MGEPGRLARWSQRREWLPEASVNIKVARRDSVAASARTRRIGRKNDFLDGICHDCWSAIKGPLRGPHIFNAA
jgi:hypothetical protein